MNERQAMNQEHPLNLRNPRVSALISGKKTHKAEIETIRELIEDVLHGRCNVLHQVGRLCGTAGIPDLYIQMPANRAWLVRNVMADEISTPICFWWEVKVGRDKLRPAQIAFIEAEKSCGRFAGVGGLSEVLAHLRSNGYKVEG